MDIGKRVRAARETREITQEELARRAGVPLNRIGRIETGAVTDPHYSSLSKIAEGLSMPIGELLGEPIPLGETLPGLKAARERLGWSRNELAVKANVPAADIPAFEDGSLKADGDTVRRLARTLDCYKGDLTIPERTPAFRAEEKEASRLQKERLLREAANTDKETIEAMRNVSPAGRKLADAIDALDEQRALEQPDAG